MDPQTIAQAIGSAAFAVALTALLRKAFPKIDGVYNYVVFGLLGIASAVLMRHAAGVPPIVWEIVGPLVTVVLGLGGYAASQAVATKGQTPPVDVRTPTRRPVDADTPVDKPLPIARDTDRMPNA